MRFRPEDVDDVALEAIMRLKAKNRPPPTSADKADVFETLFAKVAAGEADEMEQQRASTLTYFWEHIRASRAAERGGDSTGDCWQWQDVNGQKFWGDRNQQPIDLDASGLPADIVDALREGLV